MDATTFTSRKEELELEKLETEINKLKNDNNWYEKKQGSEITKYQEEIEKIRREKRWSRFLGPTFLQITPTLILVIMTFYISYQNNLFDKKSSVLALNEATLENKIVKLDIIYERKGRQMDYLNYDFSIRKDRLDASLRKMTDDSLGLVKSNIRLQEKVTDQLNKIQGMYNEVQFLSLENKFVIYHEYLQLFKKYPFANQEHTQILIDKMRLEDVISVRIKDSLKLYRQHEKFEDICTYMLYKCFQREEDFLRLLRGIEKRISLNPGSYYDTLTENQEHLNEIIGSILDDEWWSETNKIEISKKIVLELKKHPPLNAFTYYLLLKPGYYFSETPSFFEESSPLIFRDYLQINSFALHSSVDRPILKKGLTEREQVENEARFNFEYEDYINRKANILYNLTQFCPQFFASYYIKFGSIAAKKGFFRIFNLNAKNPDELSVFSIIFRSQVIQSPGVREILNDAGTNKWLKELEKLPPIEEFVSDEEFLEIFILIKNSLLDLYSQNESRVEKWMEPGISYFMKHPQDLTLKRQRGSL